MKKLILISCALLSVFVFSYFLCYNEMSVQIPRMTGWINSNDSQLLPDIQSDLTSTQFSWYTNCTQRIHSFSQLNPPWQELTHANILIHVYGAYWDNRKKGSHAIRILAMIGVGNRKSIKLQCHIWIDGDLEKKGTIKPARVNIIYNTQADYQAAIITCKINESSNNKIPTHVALDSSSSPLTCQDTTNFVPVVYNPLLKGETKQDFAICHKALYYMEDTETDPTHLLIDWIEIHRILGVKKIFMYEYFPHQNISKTLEYYQNLGYVQTKSYKTNALISPSPKTLLAHFSTRRHDKWINELIPYHDCFYRNMYKFDFISLIDIDEVIMPVNETSWSGLLKSIKKSKKPIAGYSFQNNLFPIEENFLAPEVPNDLIILQRRLRFHSKFYDKNVKLIYDTKEGVGIHNHQPFLCLAKRCQVIKVPPEIGRLNHYCLDGLKNCDNVDNVDVQLDMTVWRFKEQLVNATGNVRDDLGFT